MRRTVNAAIFSLAASLCALSQSGSYPIGTVAGSGNGDGGPATTAVLAAPLDRPAVFLLPSVGLTFDSAGNLYIADNAANRVRKVGLDGTISTFAGTGAG